MSKTKNNDGGTYRIKTPDDVSLRYYFAAAALTGLLANANKSGLIDAYARIAFQYADAMLAERERRRE